MIKPNIKFMSSIFWSLKMSYKASPWMFVVTSIITLYLSGLSGIISAYLVSMATASVASLAIGEAALKIPIIWALAYGIFTILNNLIRTLESLISSKYSNSLEVLLYSKYAEKVMILPQEDLDNPDIQEKLNSATREIYRITTTTASLQRIAGSIFGYIAAIILLWRFAWGIALLLLLVIPILIFNNYLQVKRTRRSWQESTQDYRIASGIFGAFSSPFKIFQIRIMGAKEKILILYKTHFNKAFEIEYVATKKNIYFDLLSDLLSILVDIGTRVWAIVLVGAGKLAFDQFMFVMGLIQQASSQTWSLGYSVQDLQSSYIATTSFKDIVDYPIKDMGTKKLGENKGVNIDLENAGLVYRDGTRALENIVIKIKEGQKVAIIGENGAGKSSLLKLIMKQYEPTEGEIFYDNISSKDLDKESLYSNISVLAQDYFLFDELTIRQNISVCTVGSVKEEDIFGNLALVNMESKVKSLKHGLDTRLEVSYKDGADLSGGQRQRLAIARALTKKSKLLILDEPTSSIDAKAERQIFNNIFEGHQDSTIIIVSHRFSTVRRADYIYVLEEGKIHEHGTHEELMKNNKLYAELYTIQAEDFK